MSHDVLFKTLLTEFFLDFIKLFCPEIAKLIEPGSVEFLDEETFFRLMRKGQRDVDLIAKVRIRGEAAFFIIHIEAQASSKKDFAQRMFFLFARLQEKFELPVYPIALFSFDEPLRPEPDLYRVEFPGLDVVRFRFRSIQLNRLDWRQYLRTPNPVASALMTKMRIAPQDRPRVKLECLRMLATLKLDPQRSTLIGTFMDSYLKLTAAEMIVYNRELKSLAPK